MAQQNVMQNPYGAPRAAVRDTEEFQPVRIFAVSGRLGRARYIVYSMVLTFLIMAVAGILGGLLGPAGVAVMVVAYIAMFTISIMLTIQRSHDFNMSGWFSLLALVPLVNLIFWFIPGTDGPNRFGAKTPPDVFVVARDGTLAYRGAPDADYQDPSQGAAWLRGAVEAVLADRSPDPAETEPVGCSVKWKA